MSAADPAGSPASGSRPRGGGGQGKAGDPGLWVDEHGDALFRYALSRLADRTTAEDLVQETFLAALKGQESFRGSSSPRTWLIGVLRHKLVDHFRRAGRMQRLDEPDGALSADETAFDERGRWVNRPGRWEATLPQGDLEREEFRQILERCVEGVPGRAGEAFSLRVLCDLPADEVCKVLSVKATNLWVLLHRARRRLRDCMEKTWFGADRKEEAAC